MFFLSGSHRAGPLGRTYSTGRTTGGADQVAQHPWLLEEYERSQPLSMRAGDATFHHPLVVHGAEPNRTSRARWAFIVMYVAANSVFTGASYPATDYLGLKPGSSFDHPHFPVVWQGAQP
jgi:ectoine hydroxylase-related dioxygenase (phytanoyl-CoA dioxygenase family)